MIHVLERSQHIPAPIEKVWHYFSLPANLNEITPPGMHFEIVHGGGNEMTVGQLIAYRVRIAPGVRSPWLTEIRHVRPERYFVDEQRRGPYRFWYHEHIFEPRDAGVQMTDRVTYELPYGLLGEIVHALWVRRRLEDIFDYRFAKIADIFGERV